MDKQKQKAVRRVRRRHGIRKRIIGTPTRPRLAVYRSIKHIYAQIIDDMAGRTLCAASTRDKSLGADAPGNTKAAAQVGKALAERAKSIGISKVAFDRSGFRYHGRVRALADAARESGLEL